MSEPQELMEQPLKDGAYLSPTQLDVLRTRNADVKTPADQIALLALLDSFVASNNRRDEEYRQLFDMAQKGLLCYILGQLSITHLKKDVSIYLVIYEIQFHGFLSNSSHYD